ncbi:hypothetical protein IFM58399_01862 [Aspergillus lentulus]|uniref:Uncharacterized protein n=1 Tax=Aspergillus lentulus TaxID=293939 RepID=A0ABQ1A8U6_ASPLE|nr:uncharacterized protein IFM58399_01862 [Aspergillus lentulus]GFF27999.1 hypothetical protein IFM58399_01862 [Aspergillus lentulus]GFF47820.1 hypothetical protein IFM62136_00859 [Aspergillus lentulus]GFF76329.1 hypothetical protein IFM60648_04671 [Aspergillus lentulus]GFF92040.1 hypothetical protein IFM47457_09050 [Aspergillus lentulus]GFG02698.1 hypothetical protein IFM61392_02423 [Aspergillus lentulus]
MKIGQNREGAGLMELTTGKTHVGRMLDLSRSPPKIHEFITACSTQQDIISPQDHSLQSLNEMADGRCFMFPGNVCIAKLEAWELDLKR